MCLEVRKDDVRMSRITERPLQRLERGEVLFEVEQFAMTANNITYGALMGERLGYWKLFPAEEGWGRIPVWGYLRVLASQTEGVEVGARAYGFCPPASSVAFSPVRVSPLGFMDASPPRAALDVVYNSYSWLDADDAHEPTFATEMLVLRPLFWLSFMLEDLLAEEQLLDRSILITSASSKAAIGMAHLLAQHGATTVGLTSARNTSFVERFGLHDRVLAYEDIARIARAPAVLVDVAGSQQLQTAVAAHLGSHLHRTVIAGGTHVDERGMEPESANPTTSFLFVPTRMRTRGKELGWVELNRRYCEALKPFVRAAGGWLRVMTATGPRASNGRTTRRSRTRTRPRARTCSASPPHRRTGPTRLQRNRTGERPRERGRMAPGIPCDLHLAHPRRERQPPRPRKIKLPPAGTLLVAAASRIQPAYGRPAF
jgi:NADPH:quinone reductase-like Zn-dependent oxidoreductase